MLYILLAMVFAYQACQASAYIDPDTKTDDLVSKRRNDGKDLVLAFSDEFNTPGRSFAAGDDPHFSALQKPDDTNMAIQFYNSSKEYVTTENGNLVIRTKAVKTSWVEWEDSPTFNGSKELTKNYTSGMLQSWNKFCFTGGVLEMRIRLPGHSDSGGLWPAVWLMGNLGRATFPDSVMNHWPWSYDQCESSEKAIDKKDKDKKDIDKKDPDLDLPKSESESIDSIDSIDPRGKQAINACESDPGYGMNPYQGRGSPEIDIFEIMPGHEMPGQGNVKAFMSNSLQVCLYVCMSVSFREVAL